MLTKANVLAAVNKKQRRGGELRGVGGLDSCFAAVRRLEPFLRVLGGFIEQS